MLGGLSGYPSLSDIEPTLADPGADRIVFWDESNNQFDFLIPGTGLSLTGNTLAVSGLTVSEFASDAISQWNNDAGYLTSFTELDPVFGASSAASITGTDISNWDAAFGWGNHASAGYLTSVADATTSTKGIASFNATNFTVTSGAVNTIQGIGTGASPQFTGLNLSGLSATRLLSTDGSKNLASVADLASFVAGTTNQVSVANDGDGTITLSTPQSIHTGASPQFTGLNLSGLSASRLVSTDASKNMASVTNLTNFIAGTTNRITVTNDGDGTVTLSAPQNIHTGASPTFTGLTVSGLTANRLVSTNGSSALASITDLTSWIAGTANQISVANDGDGSVTLSTPQNIGTGSSPTFAGLTIGSLNGVLKASSGVVSGSATTSDLPEGSNLYYTDARVRAALSGTSPITFNSGSGAIGLDLTASYTWTGAHAFQSNLSIGVSAGTGTSSDFDWYSAQGDYSTGTVTTTNGSTTVTGSGTSWTSDMIGLYISLQYSNAIHRITAVGSATSLTLDRAYRGTTAGAGQTYNIYGASIKYESESGVSATFEDCSARFTRFMAIGSGAQLGGTLGTSAVHIKESLVPVSSLDVNAALEFEGVLRKGSVAGLASALNGIASSSASDSYSIVVGLVAFASTLDVNHTAFATSLCANYYARGDVDAASAMDSAFGYYKQTFTGESTGAYGIYLEEETIGTSVNWQIYSVAGNWFLGEDGSRFYMGTAQDAYFEYDGTNLNINPKAFGSGVVNVAGGVVTDGQLAVKSSGSATNLTADNQNVTVGDRSHIFLSSDNATATNRTFTLSNGSTDGQVLVLVWKGSNAGEIVASSNAKLSATWTPTEFDTLTLVWEADATAWVEVSRSANA